MNKEDIKIGMLVILRSGEKCIVMPDRYGDTKNNLILVGEENKIDKTTNCWDYIRGYDDNLKASWGGGKYDIMEIWSYGCEYIALIKSTKNRTLLWKRSETVELTLQEIADKFNINVEDLRVKDR